VPRELQSVKIGTLETWHPQGSSEEYRPQRENRRP
jgi:hypothetical protein